MESMAGMGEGEWRSLSGMYNTTNEESDFIAQLLGDSASGSDFWSIRAGSMDLLGGQETSSYSFSLDVTNNVYTNNTTNSSFSFSQESTSYSGAPHKGYYVTESQQYPVLSLDICVGDSTNTYLVDQMSECNMEELKKNPQESEEETEPKMDVEGLDHQTNKSSESNKKRPRNSGEAQKKNKRNAKWRKNQKCMETCGNDEDSSNNTKLVLNRQISSNSLCSVDESNGSQESNQGATSSTPKGKQTLNLNARTRAGRGAASDPQSLYARKRRERINERLKILQSLVPNGTKVDISTMLEEAVQYVKFLQLQIKLLSSDDLWMYAPIAYNGMDIGLDLNLITPR